MGTHDTTSPHAKLAPLVPLAAFAAFAFMLIVPIALRDGDTGWHLATGAWVVAHGSVPTVDPFSYTAPGRAWVAHEWLSELAMYLAYRGGGWSGLILLFAVALGALYTIVTRELIRWLSLPASLLALSLLTTGLLPSLLARPHLLALPLLAAWLVILLHAREAGRAPHPVYAMLMLVWANAHGSFVFGLALTGVFALEALLAAAPADRIAVAMRWAGFGLLALLAAIVTPAGVHGLLFPFYVSSLKLLPYLNEWQPADFATFSGFEAIILVTLGAMLVRPTQIAPLRLFLLIGVLHLALQHTRQEIVFVVVGALLLAEPIGRAWHSAHPRVTPHAPRELRAILIVLAIMLGAYRITVPVVRDDSAGVPATALARLPAQVRDRRVFNEYSFGGALILAGIRPYIDGRSDMYGDAFTIDYFQIAKGDAARWAAADAKWHFGWTLLPPSSAIVARLDTDPHWYRAYANDVAVIHIRC